MADLNDPRMVALAPLTRRVRRDVTATKTNGRQAWTSEPLTRLRLAQHLNGGPARGVCPILPGTSVTLVGLYDLDSHGGMTPWDVMAVTGAALVDALSLVWGCTPICFRSSGGRGIHIYVVWDEAQQARDVRRWMAGVLTDLGLRSGTKGLAHSEVEVFPKQDSVPADGYGNQFILPLSGSSELLVPCDLSGALVPTAQPLDASMWQGSPPVPAAAPDEYVRPLKSKPLAADAYGVWLEALDAIPNGRGDGDGPDTSLGYDDWRNVIFAIHYETGGTAEGLEIARDWSERSPKYDPEFLADRVWQYIRPDRSHPITGGTICRIAHEFGWRPAVPDTAFPCEPIDEAVAAAEREEHLARLASGPVAAVPGGAGDTPAQPEALAECSDFANAVRLANAGRGRMLALGGQWYVWDGRRYAPDLPAALRESCELSKLVRADAEAAEARARVLLLSLEGFSGLSDDVDMPKSKDMDKAAAKLRGSDEDLAARMQAAAKAVHAAEALRGWVTASEMRPRIEAGLKLAEAHMAAAAGSLDADPWLVTCLNGTVDLRTGELRPHSAADKITQLIPLEYDPQAEADAGAWEDVLLQICCGDRELMDFLRRWYGYCLTGHVREQVFVIHYGGGSNGKSLLLDLMQATSGEYAVGAPPGLVASTRGDTMKDTELAVLRGRRMVTAHESRAGAELREDLVKLATGDDVITARHLYGSHFDFKPTHKLQLLTNHRPVVRTQDYGTWRRIVLVPYGAKFGTPDEVTRGEATAVADRMLAEKLRRPEMLRAVLAWRVRGAVEWAQQGLAVPASVRLSSQEYQSEQDRAKQFLDECCELGPEFSAYLSGGPSLSTVYVEYSSWIREAGGHAMSRQRLLQDLRRLGITAEQQGRAVLLRGLRLNGPQ